VALQVFSFLFFFKKKQKKTKTSPYFGQAFPGDDGITKNEIYIGV
jgi:hypothetical protein